MRSKNGVSPLVATFGLLALAFGLGIVVMNWGRASLEERAACTVETSLNIIELNGVQQLCYGGKGDTGFITFMVENGPYVDIAKLQFRAIGSKRIYVTDLEESSIKKDYPLVKTVPYNFDLFGAIKQIKLTPRVILFPGDEPLSCPEQAIVVEDIRAC